MRTPPSLLTAALVASIGCGAQPPPVACPAPVLAEPATCAPAAPPPTPAEPAAEDTRTVVLDGTPEIPSALMGRLSQYLETRSASLMSLSDDGRRMLITTRFHETAQIHEVAGPLGMRRQLTFTREPIAEATYVPRDPDVFLYSSDIGGAENYQFFRYDRRAGRSILITDGHSRHQALMASPDGSQIAFVNNRRNGRDMDIYVSDGRTPESARLLLEVSGTWGILDFSRDGTKLLVYEYLSINESRVFVLDIATRALTRITPEAPIASYRAAVFDSRAERVYLTTDRFGEHIELYEVDLRRPETTWRPLSNGIAWSVEEIALAPNGRTLAFTTNEDGYSVLRLMNTQTRASRIVAGIPRGVVSALRFARGAEVLGFSLARPTTSTDAYTFDLRRNALSRYTESEMGGLDPAGFIEPTLFRYRSFDGREIPAFLYMPPGAGPFPVAIDIHGGPEGQARPTFNPLTQYLARESGIAVIVPNVRGSDGYGKTYLQLDNGRSREDSVRDIGALLDHVATLPTLDARRVAVVGGSYGGYMVLASLVHFADRIRAGVDVVGIANFVTFLENTAPYRRDLRRAEYGDESDGEMRAFLQSISPVTRVDRIQSALFVAHGANDPRVPAAEAEQIVQAVRANGRDVWYMLARNEGHGFRKRENRDAYLSLTVLFLEKHLHGEGAAPRGN